MSDRGRSFANEDDEAQYYLGVLRDGAREQKIEARERLSAIFERKGMVEEAVELLEGNARAGVTDLRLFTALISLYRQLGRYDDADAATEHVSMLVSKRQPRPTAPPELPQLPPVQEVAPYSAPQPYSQPPPTYPQQTPNYPMVHPQQQPYPPQNLPPYGQPQQMAPYQLQGQAPQPIHLTVAPQMNNHTVVQNRVTVVMAKQSPPFIVRLLYFLIIGWWFGFMWLGCAILLICLVVTLPLGVYMLAKLPKAFFL